MVRPYTHQKGVVPVTTRDDRRAESHERLQEWRDFKTHLITYVSVNAGLFAYWALSGGGEYWPSWALFGWGIGVAVHGFLVWFGVKRPSEDRVEHEVERIHGHISRPHATG